MRDKNLMANHTHTEDEKKRAAYALNMCTVSVSQIVDYHDSYILEQEYDAILNNLNLKQMPKDEALLKIITELLNTITYFRIQEIKKQQIEKKYQQRIKNALWSAVPSLSVVVSGNPVAIALSIATQVGTGYMNYRKEKVSAAADREDAEIELQITAIEQLNALKRELFTTAWRLADEYDFDDNWRLTEKQIKQYNAILMDTDDLRKYSRLEAIADKFAAYPPFWYFYGHTANYIAETAKSRMLEINSRNEAKQQDYYQNAVVAKLYTDKAKQHYEEYYKLMDFNILREDQLTASFALEYVDLLWNDDKRDDNKIADLLKLAETMGANSFDILQLCAISYLKIGKTTDAARLLKILVNEEYNTSSNAKLLSRIYVSDYLFADMNSADKAFTEYKLLSDTTETVYLFPMPISHPQNAELEDKELQQKYIEEQKMLLQKDYRNAINEFIKICIANYNKLWPVPSFKQDVTESYFDYTIESSRMRTVDVKKAFDGVNRNEYIAALRDSSFRVKYLDLLNEVLRALDELEIFRTYEDKDELILPIRKKIVQTRVKLKEYQRKLESGTFDFEDYENMQNLASFKTFTEDFFDKLKTTLMEQLEHLDTISAAIDKTPMEYLESAGLDLIDFCRNNHISDPDTLRKNRRGTLEISNCNYFDYSILGEDVDDELGIKARREEMAKAVKQAANGLVVGAASDVAVLLPGDSAFESYFCNVKFGGEGLKANVIAIIDDKTKKDYDLLLTYEGYVIVNKNAIQPIRDYKRIDYAKLGSGDVLEIGWPDKYSNKNIDIAKLYSLIQKLIDISTKA